MSGASGIDNENTLSAELEDLELTFAKYPDLLTGRDLVNMGLYPSLGALYKAMNKGTTPPYFSRGVRGVRFTKASVIRWLLTNDAE